MRWSIRIFNIPPPPGNPLRSNSCALGPKLCSNSHPGSGFNQKFFLCKISNPDQFLSTLSPRPSAFCLWKWIFYLKTPPYQKSKHIHSAGKTCQICFKLPTPVRQGSNSLPPRMDDRQITMGCPEGRMLKLQIDRHITGNKTFIY